MKNDQSWWASRGIGIARGLLLFSMLTLASQTFSDPEKEPVENDPEVEIEAPGWDAIDAALAELYPEVEPLHYGTVQKYAVGGADPIDGISIYRVDEPEPHWHFVTFGFSDLYFKETEDPAVSGYGFELTLRLERGEEETEPALLGSFWNLLQNLARYVFETGSPLGSGHVFDLNGPIVANADTAITALGFAPDPDLPALNTPHGRVEFLQVIGMTDDELLAARAWDKRSFFEVMSRKQPRWILDLGRPSILKDDAIQEEILRGIEKEGSSTDHLLVSHQTVRKGPGRGEVTWTLGASAIEGLRHTLPGRIPFGRPLTIQSDEAVVVIEPGKLDRVDIGQHGALQLTLTEGTARALVAALQPQRGGYRLDEVPDLRIEVVPSLIRNREGKVVKEIG